MDVRAALESFVLVARWRALPLCSVRALDALFLGPPAHLTL
jgi:hypothetical protein